MVEHLVANEKVAGSNPVSRSTTKKAQRQSLWAFFIFASYSRDMFYTTPVQNILAARNKYLFYPNKDRFYTIFKINPLRFLADVLLSKSCISA